MRNENNSKNKNQTPLDKNITNNLGERKVRKGAIEEPIEKKQENQKQQEVFKKNKQKDIQRNIQKQEKKEQQNFSNTNEFEKEELNDIVKKMQKEVEVLTEIKLNKKLSDGIDILNKHNKKIKFSREQRVDEHQRKIIKEKFENDNKYKKRLTLKSLMLTVILIFVIIVIYLFFEYGPVFGISLNKEKGIANEGKISITTTDEDIYDMYNNELMIYSNQTITTYNKNAKKTWEYKLAQTFTPKIYIKNQYMVISNNATGNIYLFENKNEILNKKIDGVVEKVYLDEYGNIAVEYSAKGYKKIIGVYSKKGKNLYNSYFSNGSIIDIKLIEKGQKLIVAQTETLSFSSGVKISLIDGLNKAEDGEVSNNNIREIVKIDNNLIYSLTILKENIIMLLDNKIIKCNIKTGEITTIKDFNVGQMMFITLSSNYYSYIEKPLEEKKDSYIINTNRFDNTIISSSESKNSPKTMRNSGVLNYFIYQDKIQVINKWGISIKNISIQTVPKNIVIFNKEKSVALIYTNKVYIVNM
jgi:hypothetical protein